MLMEINSTISLLPSLIMIAQLDIAYALMDILEPPEPAQCVPHHAKHVLTQPQIVSNVIPHLDWLSSPWLVQLLEGFSPRDQHVFVLSQVPHLMPLQIPALQVVITVALIVIRLSLVQVLPWPLKTHLVVVAQHVTWQRIVLTYP